MKFYFSVSGGKDSTAMVLKAYEEGIAGTLIYGDTRLNLKHALPNVERLSKYTGFPLLVARYEGDEKPIVILKESFLRIPQAIEHMKKTGVFRRNMFRCCNILKHGPLIALSKQQDEDSCFGLGMKGSDHAVHRIYRMSELRKWDTFYRRIVKTGLLQYYPLRDWTQEQVDSILKKHGFKDVRSTGCAICPIFCMFENWRKKDPDTWRRSILFADRLGVEHPAQGQQFLPNLDCW
jgi:3'-phosphoadenosine 5'-phosphosulfate sulfotransferase (PAPS reductase)/FAD synthetase